jgi:hypothetical protein
VKNLSGFTVRGLASGCFLITNKLLDHWFGLLSYDDLTDCIDYEEFIFENSVKKGCARVFWNGVGPSVYELKNGSVEVSSLKSVAHTIEMIRKFKIQKQNQFGPSQSPQAANIHQTPNPDQGLTDYILLHLEQTPFSENAPAIINFFSIQDLSTLPPSPPPPHLQPYTNFTSSPATLLSTFTLLGLHPKYSPYLLLLTHQYTTLLTLISATPDPQALLTQYSLSPKFLLKILTQSTQNVSKKAKILINTSKHTFLPQIQSFITAIGLTEDAYIEKVIGEIDSFYIGKFSVKFLRQN